MIVVLPENYSCFLYRNIGTVTLAYWRLEILRRKAKNQQELRKKRPAIHSKNLFSLRNGRLKVPSSLWEELCRKSNPMVSHNATLREKKFSLYKARINLQILGWSLFPHAWHGDHHIPKRDVFECWNSILRMKRSNSKRSSIFRPIKWCQAETVWQENSQNLAFSGLFQEFENSRLPFGEHGETVRVFVDTVRLIDNDHIHPNIKKKIRFFFQRTALSTVKN